MKLPLLLGFSTFLLPFYELAQNQLAPPFSVLRQPQPRQSPQANDARQFHFRRLPLGLNASGPETVAFDCDGGGPYVGVSDGRILEWRGDHVGWTVFAVTSPHRPSICDGLNNSPKEKYCGRPLGIKFNPVTCELYVADSSFGLLKVDRSGGVAVPLVTGTGGVPFRFLNALDIDAKTGFVYFTDTSLYYHRWEYQKAIDTLDRSGRLMKYDPRTRTVTTLLRGLAFANGVALSRRKDFVLVAETSAFQVRRFWLAGPKAGMSDMFIHLTGRPDNINRNDEGDFWIAQNPTKPVKVDERGRTVEILDSNDVVYPSDVSEFHNRLWIGSVVQSYVLYSEIIDATK